MFVLYRRGVVAFATLTMLALSTGCGPVISSYLILSAQAELDGAEAAEAEKYAPYEYAAAEQYLHKAREEQGYAHFQPAIEFAFKAQDLAERGRVEAKKRKEKELPPEGVPDSGDEPTAEPAPQPAVNPPPQEAPPSGNPNVIIKKKPAPEAPAQKAPAPPSPPPEAKPQPRIQIKKVPAEPAPAPNAAAPKTAPTPPPDAAPAPPDAGDDTAGDDTASDAAPAPEAPKEPSGPITPMPRPEAGGGA